MEKLSKPFEGKPLAKHFYSKNA